METLHTWWATELYPMRERDQFGVSGEFEVVLATDAQATIAALQARVNGLEKDSELLRQSRDDFRVKYESVKNDAITLQSQLTQRTAELEAAKRLATNAQWQIDYLLDEAKKAFELTDSYTPSDLVDCVLRPASSMLKERDELKAELERVRGERDELKGQRDTMQEHINLAVPKLQEADTLRTLITTLPKVEGDWTVSCALAVTVVTGGIVRDISEVVAAIVQHRQGMEG